MNVETESITLTAGTYVIDAFEFENVDSDDDGLDICYTMELD